jgi:uncharacterized protein YegJ (DUF2314 family)
MFDTSDIWGRRNWGERMWVKVVAIKKRHIVGVLRNQPIGIPRLDFGDQLKFTRDHIIDIDWEPPDDACECQHAAKEAGHYRIEHLHMPRYCSPDARPRPAPPVASTALRRL